MWEEIVTYLKYFGVNDRILTFGPTQNNVVSKTTDWWKVMVMMIRLVGSNSNNDQTGGKIIHFCLLYEKVRDSYFEYFGVEDGILLLVRLRIALLVEQVIDLRYLTMAIVVL